MPIVGYNERKEGKLNLMKKTILTIIFAILTYFFSACSTHEPTCSSYSSGAQANPYSTYNYTKPMPYQNVW